MPAKTLERTESVASVDLSWEGLRQPMPLVIEQHFHGLVIHGEAEGLVLTPRL